MSDKTIRRDGLLLTTVLVHRFLVPTLSSFPSRPHMKTLYISKRAPHLLLTAISLHERLYFDACARMQ